jgi:hypothetical protein
MTLEAATEYWLPFFYKARQAGKSAAQYYKHYLFIKETVPKEARLRKSTFKALFKEKWWRVLYHVGYDTSSYEGPGLLAEIKVWRYRPTQPKGPYRDAEMKRLNDIALAVSSKMAPPTDTEPIEAEEVEQIGDDEIAPGEINGKIRYGVWFKGGKYLYNCQGRAVSKPPVWSPGECE